MAELSSGVSCVRVIRAAIKSTASTYVSLRAGKDDHIANVGIASEHLGPKGYEYHYLLYVWGSVEEKRASIKNDPCLETHTSVIGILHQAEDVAEDVKKRVEEIVHFWNETSDSTATKQPQIEWALPASAMLEEAFERLWLHIHVVELNCCPSWISSTYTDNSHAKSRENKDEFADWIHLKRIPIIIVSA
jgi:hypothetical protein